MKLIKLFFLVVISFAISMMLSCSKDDDSDNGNQDNDAPEFQAKNVDVPDYMEQSSDPYASMAVNYVTMANSFTGYTSSFTPPTKSTGFLKSTMDGPWTYTWTVEDGGNSYTVTLTITEEADGYSWTLTITGIMNGIELNNFVYMEAWQSHDEKSGSFKLYSPETGEAIMIVTWDMDENGVYTCTFEIPGDVLIEVIANPDGSGSLEVKKWHDTQYLLSFKAVWDSTGHGEWWTYDKGVLQDHGTW